MFSWISSGTAANSKGLPNNVSSGDETMKREAGVNSQELARIDPFINSSHGAIWVCRAWDGTLESRRGWRASRPWLAQALEHARCVGSKAFWRWFLTAGMAGSLEVDFTSLDQSALSINMDTCFFSVLNVELWCTDSFLWHATSEF